MGKKDTIEIPRNRLFKLLGIVLDSQMKNKGGFSGQAFTKFECLSCDMPHMHPNTNVPYFCAYCEEQIMIENKKLIGVNNEI